MRTTSTECRQPYTVTPTLRLAASPLPVRQGGQRPSGAETSRQLRTEEWPATASRISGAGQTRSGAELVAGQSASMSQ